ncbi:MAG TPA: ribonuclease H-like domain-containing protein, partial [Candidatus Saccharimonadales bacterium]|nr:ribonuclease H-like domain-containing protein [Candidatus Saccharimonadales bacterium]
EAPPTRSPLQPAAEAPTRQAAGKAEVLRSEGASEPGKPRILFLDVETLRSAEEVGGWGRIREMGIALAVVYDTARGEFRTFLPAEADRLAVQLLSADLVVGFNIRRFDYEVLRAASEADFSKIPTLDMLEEIHARLGFRLSLGHLAEATLGVSKSADGLQSLRWVREGRMDLVETYCRHDVEITRDLYEFGRRHGYLLFLDREGRRVRCPVSWAAAAP